MIGNSHFDGLLAALPGTSNQQAQAGSLQQAKVDWNGYAEALQACAIDPSSVTCLSYCTHKVANIEANFGDYGLAALHPTGVMVSTGGRSVLGKKLKLWTVDFGRCKVFGPVEHSDPRNYGRYCIEFAGPGSVLLGRLEWNWTGKRFRDSSELMMNAAEERDRYLAQVEAVLR